MQEKKRANFALMNKGKKYKTWERLASPWLLRMTPATGTHNRKGISGLFQLTT